VSPHDDTGYPIVKFDYLWFAARQLQRFTEQLSGLRVCDLKSGPELVVRVPKEMVTVATKKGFRFAPMARIHRAQHQNHSAQVAIARLQSQH
jgi:hypothetical protein